MFLVVSRNTPDIAQIVEIQIARNRKNARMINCWVDGLRRASQLEDVSRHQLSFINLDECVYAYQTKPHYESETHEQAMVLMPWSSAISHHTS